MCSSLSGASLLSDEDELVWLGIGFAIKIDRNYQDWLGLDKDYWEGMRQGLDGYPSIDENGDFMIGGADRNFKPKTIEFYSAVV